MVGILQIVKDRLLAGANRRGTYVDFTMGKGRDTLFLCRLAPEGQVFAFDIQQPALDATAALLSEQGIQNARLIRASHDRFAEFVPGPIDGGLFNLGFLPGGDRRLTTLRATTLPAVCAAARALKKDGVLGVSVYPGHEEGRLEGELLQEELARLPRASFDVFLYRLLNIPQAPYTLVIERRA